MSLMGLALLAASTAAEPKISAAVGDWSNIPPVTRRQNTDGLPFIVDKIEAAVRSGECKIPGVSRRRMKLSVPFLLQFDRSGAVTEVVVQKLNCPSVETAMGNAILRVAQKGDYRPTGQNAAGWYRGVLNVDSQ